MAWLKEKLLKFKKWIIALIFGVAALAAGIDIAVETPAELISGELTNISAVQRLKLSEKGKYQYYPYRVINNIGYIINEYETPKGEVGYTAVITKKGIDGIYRKAVSNGVEGESRSHDWIKIIDFATTTISTL